MSRLVPRKADAFGIRAVRPAQNRQGLPGKPSVKLIKVEYRLSPTLFRDIHMNQHDGSPYISRLARLVLYATFPCLLLIAEARSAPPLLRCQLSQFDDQRTVDFVPVSDPYTNPKSFTLKFRRQASPATGAQ